MCFQDTYDISVTSTSLTTGTSIEIKNESANKLLNILEVNTKYNFTDKVTHGDEYNIINWDSNICLSLHGPLRSIKRKE